MNKFNNTKSPTQQINKNPMLPNQLESDLIKYTLDMKFLSVSQIYRKFKTGIESLIARGYLTSKDQTLCSLSLVRATPEAHSYLKSHNPNMQVAEPIKAIWTPRVNHDLSLIDIRMRFEELNFISKWYSEQMLKESGFMNKMFVDLPDALCKKNDGTSYFLELEISGKTKKDYIERIDLYSRVLEQEEIKNQKIEGLIFVCTDPKVIETIKSLLPKNDKRFSCLSITRYLKDYEGHKVTAVAKNPSASVPLKQLVKAPSNKTPNQKPESTYAKQA